jgi:hypothetical protein
MQTNIIDASARKQQTPPEQPPAEQDIPTGD